MFNTRTLVDVNLTKSVALPAANATAYTPVLDLLTVTAGRIPCVELTLATGALPSLVDAKTVTLTVQDSADGVTFATAADLPTYVATGAGGAGAAAISAQVKLPLNLRRYVRLGATVLAAGGDNTAVSATIGLVF